LQFTNETHEAYALMHWFTYQLLFVLFMLGILRDTSYQDVVYIFN